MLISDISFTYPHSTKPVLKEITFHAESGKLTTILGPNGSGKTTLFKCITGLLSPQKGDILYEGKSIVHWGYERRAKIIAVVPQEHESPFPYTVFDVVLMGRAAHLGMFSLPSKRDIDKANKTLEMVGIDHLNGQPYTKISGGERQLVLIARALAQEPKILLLDEPINHLDIKNQLEIMALLKMITKELNLTTVIVLHDLSAAMRYADTFALLKEGTLYAYGGREVIIPDTIRAVYHIDATIADIKGVSVVVPMK